MLSLDRTQQPPYKLIDKIHIIRAKPQKLDNSLPVYVIEAGEQDLVRLEFIFEAGTYYQPYSLVANFTNSLLSEGTKKRTSAEISEKLDFYGAFLEADTGKHSASIVLYTLNKYLAETLEMLEDILKNPTFPQKELETLIRKKKQKFIVENTKVETIAKGLFAESIFGKQHPYGKIVQLQDFDRVKQEWLVDFYQQHYHSKNCKIIVAGKIENSLLSLLNKYFGENDWEKSSPTKSFFIPILPTDEKKIYLPKKDAVQSAIRIGRVLFSKQHPDYQPLQVLNTVLGGYFGSRLMKNIREEKGFTYGIYSLVASYRTTGYFLITAEVGKDTREAAVKEIYAEMKKLRDEFISQEELSLVKNSLLGELLRIFDGPFALAETFKSLLEYDLDYEYYERLIETVKTITAFDLYELADIYFRPEYLTEIVVG